MKEPPEQVRRSGTVSGYCQPFWGSMCLIKTDSRSHWSLVTGLCFSSYFVHMLTFGLFFSCDVLSDMICFPDLFPLLKGGGGGGGGKKKIFLDGVHC